MFLVNSKWCSILMTALASQRQKLCLDCLVAVMTFRRMVGDPLGPIQQLRYKMIYRVFSPKMLMAMSPAPVRASITVHLR